MDKAALPKCF